MSQPSMDETTLDLNDLVKIIKKRKRLIIGFFLAFVIGAAVVSFLMPKVYEADTTLRIKQEDGLGSSLLSGITNGNPLMTQQKMSTYAEIMQSRTVLEKVICRVYGAEAVKKKITYEVIQKQFTMTPVKNTEILQVQAQAESPARAQLLANTLVETFLERITYLTRSEQVAVRMFIGERLKSVKKELDGAETRLEAYKRGQRIVAPDEESKAIITQIADLDKLRAENEVELAASQAKLGDIHKQLASEKPGYIAESALIQQYKSKLADQEVQLVGLLQKYTEKHPDVIALRASIDETKEKMNEEIGRVVNTEASSLNPVHQGLLQGKLTTEAEVAAAAAQQKALQRIMLQQEGNITKLPSKEQGLVRVTRDATVAQQLYMMLAQKYEEARISEVLQPTDVQVVDTAEAPDPAKPLKPNKRLNVLIAAFLGLFAGIGLAFALEYLNKTIDSAEDVRDYLGLPVIGKIPDFATGEEPKGGFWKNVMKSPGKKTDHR